MTHEETILTALHHARPMVYQFAMNYGLDVEDLLQDAAVVIMENIDKVLATCGDRPIYPYLKKCIKYTLIDMMKAHRNHESLDAPLGDDDDMTLADLLPAAPDVPTDSQDEKRAIRREQALHSALHDLPLEEQQYMRRVYNLNAFYPLPRDWTRKPDYGRRADSLSRMAYRRLRKDRVLAAIVAITGQRSAAHV